MGMADTSAIPVLLQLKTRSFKMTTQITIRSDRDTDYTFQYKGEDVTLKAGGILSIADGLDEVVLPTCAMKIVKNLIVIKGDVK
jgi:hypothetical protein